MDYPAVLKAMMDRGNLNQSGLADRLHVEQSTVSRLLKGGEPKAGLHTRIISEAQRLGVLSDPLPDLPSEENEVVPATVRVVGYVGAGAEAHFYSVNQGDLDEVPAPKDTTESTVAVEVRGQSLGKLFDRWLVFYDDVRRPVTPDLIGHLCVIGLENGQVLVKKLTRSRASGLFDLISETADPIRDTAIEWAARVKSMAPR